MNYKIIFSFLFATVTVFLFQNCQSSTESRFAEALKSTSASTSNSSTAGLSSNSTQSSSSGGTDATTTLKVSATSSASAQTDCSKSDATVSQQIVNVGADILVCAEYKLDMPTTSKRYGEFYNCDSSEKFKTPPSSWAYNQIDRSWSAPIEQLRNHAYIVPGTYRIVIKDNVGSVYRSNDIVVRKAGSENCFASTATMPTSGTSCSWSGIVIGPEASPTASCTKNNVGAKAVNDRGTQFTCVCR